MFIPRGKPIYSGLATSFILVDALVADLCENSFSGIVEINLSSTQFFVIISLGGISSSIRFDGARCLTSSVAEAASAARSGKGTVSVFSLSPETAQALAGLSLAKPLYTQLSTEFADLKRMIKKLQREHDREWYIELRTENGIIGLIHIREDTKWAISCRDIINEGEAVLEDLLKECTESGGQFDVLYIRPGEMADPSDRVRLEAEFAAIGEPPGEESIFTETTIGDTFEEDLESISTVPVFEEGRLSFQVDDATADTIEERDKSSAVDSQITLLPLQDDMAEESLESASVFRTEPHIATPVSEYPFEVAKTPTPVIDRDAEVIVEVKQLMGELTSAVEAGARAVEPRDTFSIYLRAGQLKIADRFPFLDPFGYEFEYHAGEIVFSGKTHPHEFITGLTEALRLAVVSVIEASTQPVKMRNRITEDLEKLLDEKREIFEKFGLDKSVEQIIADGNLTA